METGWVPVQLCPAVGLATYKNVGFHRTPFGGARTGLLVRNKAAHASFVHLHTAFNLLPTPGTMSGFLLALLCSLPPRKSADWHGAAAGRRRPTFRNALDTHAQMF